MEDFLLMMRDGMHSLRQSKMLLWFLVLPKKHGVIIVDMMWIFEELHLSEEYHGENLKET